MERALLHTCCPASSHHGREASVEQLCCEAQRVAPPAPPLYLLHRALLN
ncbi:MAG: hypothetical protein U0326_30420 [Polyangiales bacterium]